MTGAHGFVLLSGVVMGLVYAAVIGDEGLSGAARRLGRRALTLYAVAVGLGLFDMAWGFAPFNGTPSTAIDWHQVGGILTLTNGSDDLMTFYLMLILLAPAVLFLAARGWSWLAAAASLAAWLLHTFNERLLNPPLVYFVPLADWQVLFVAGLLVGYNRPALSAFFAGRRRWAYLGLLGTLLVPLLVLQFWFVAGPGLDETPGWVTYLTDQVWQGYDHNPPLHMVALFVYMLCIFQLADWLWVPLSSALGWFLIPLGQAALYVYALHAILVFYVLAALPGFSHLEGSALTFSLLGLMLALWVMVKRRFLFRLVPR